MTMLSMLLSNLALWSSRVANAAEMRFGVGDAMSVGVGGMPIGVGDAMPLPAGSGHSLVPSHDIAMWILHLIRVCLRAMGLDKHDRLEEVVYVVVVLVVALAIGWVIRRVVLWAVGKIVGLRHTDVGEELLQEKTLTSCSHIITPLVLMAFVPFAFEHDEQGMSIFMRLTIVYALLALAVGLCGILRFVWVHYDTHDNRENHPLRGVFNVGRGVVWIVISIVSVSVLIDKSPMSLLAGLGAFAAALMLIFKDSILGFVAGIQLSQNDMLRVGDWIVVPSTIANGIVTDVSLSVVKVRNWDNTTVMLPPYTLVSTSFQNWRGMTDSGYRHIDEHVYIDHSTIVEATAEMQDRIATEYPLIADYIAARQKAEAAGEGNVYNGDTTKINGSIDTNLGLFRAYMCAYLLHHPAIAHNQTILVRLLQGEAWGATLDFYCYTNTTVWGAFEAIRTEVMEHVHSVAPRFGLALYSPPLGNKFSVEEAAVGAMDKG